MTDAPPPFIISGSPENLLRIWEDNPTGAENFIRDISETGATHIRFSTWCGDDQFLHPGPKGTRWNTWDRRTIDFERLSEWRRLMEFSNSLGLRIVVYLEEEETSYPNVTFGWNDRVQYYTAMVLMFGDLVDIWVTAEEPRFDDSVNRDSAYTLRQLVNAYVADPSRVRIGSHNLVDRPQQAFVPHVEIIMFQGSVADGKEAAKRAVAEGRDFIFAEHIPFWVGHPTDGNGGEEMARQIVWEFEGPDGVEIYNPTDQALFDPAIYTSTLGTYASNFPLRWAGVPQSAAPLLGDTYTLGTDANRDGVTDIADPRFIDFLKDSE